uniref:Stress enhanced protein 2 n=1 Tax=Kalanchoe fedtschenkoi TaxID=63787 RepID=A0A7N0UQM1_KALFE
MAARAIHCRLPEIKSARKPTKTTPLSRLRPRIDSDKDKNLNGNNNTKIVLQPRLATLRSYGSDGPGVFKTARDGGISEQVSPFVDKLFDYIDTTKKSHDFEIVSGRLAMMVFAATVTTEVLTGSSIFQKLDAQGIDDAAVACLGAIGFAAVFAWVSIARQRVGGLFDLTRNAFIDSVVDQIVDGLFELSDWTDEA